jgi:hypothetical protein
MAVLAGGTGVIAGEGREENKRNGAGEGETMGIEYGYKSSGYN